MFDGRIVAVGGDGNLAVRANGALFRSTCDAVTLLTEYVDGSCVHGRGPAAAGVRRIRRVSLKPGRARATPEVVEAISTADAIVIGPGSLFACLLPTLLVRDIAKAIATSPAPVVLVMNLMTEPGETDGYTGTDIVLALRRHAPQLPLAMTVLVNSTPLPTDEIDRAARQGSVPVVVDDATLTNLGCKVVRAPLLATGEGLRHDAERVKSALHAHAVVTLK